MKLAQAVESKHATTPFKRALLEVPEHWKLVARLVQSPGVPFGGFCDGHADIGPGVLKTLIHNANGTKSAAYKHVCTVELPRVAAVSFDVSPYPKSTYKVGPGGVITVDLCDSAEEGWGMLTNYADMLNRTGLHRPLSDLGKRVIARVTPYYLCGVVAHFGYPEGGIKGDETGVANATALQGLTDHLEFLVQARSMAGRALRNLHDLDAATDMFNKGLECLAPFAAFGSTKAPQWLKTNVRTIARHLRTDLNAALAITAEKREGQAGQALLLRRRAYAQAQASGELSHLARAASALALGIVKGGLATGDIFRARSEAEPMFAQAVTFARDYYAKACTEAGEGSRSFTAAPGAGDWESPAPAYSHVADATNALTTALIYSATSTITVAEAEKDRMLAEALGICRVYHDAANAIEALLALSNRASNLHAHTILAAGSSGDAARLPGTDAASLATAQEWRSELVLLLKRQGKDPGGECCVCLDALDGDGGVAGERAAAPPSVFVFSGCYHQVHGDCVKDIAASAPASFKLPPCPLCRSC